VAAAVVVGRVVVAAGFADWNEPLPHTNVQTLGAVPAQLKPSRPGSARAAVAVGVVVVVADLAVGASTVPLSHFFWQTLGAPLHS
jgi:hypothetical protein